MTLYNFDEVGGAAAGAYNAVKVMSNGLDGGQVFKKSYEQMAKRTKTPITAA